MGCADITMCHADGYAQGAIGRIGGSYPASGGTSRDTGGYDNFAGLCRASNLDGKRQKRVGASPENKGLWSGSIRPRGAINQ